MKRLILFAVGSVTLCLLMSSVAQADDLLPGQVDFGSFAPPTAGGEFVEVNVPEGLIGLGARFCQKAEPEVAKLLDGLKLVRVNVIGLSAENRLEMQKRAEKVRKDLSGSGWERIVTVQEKDQDVGVYLKITKNSVVQGLVAVVMDGKQHAVFANVVGEIKPEQLTMLGEKLNIDPLKEIGHAAGKSADKPKTEEKPQAEEMPKADK